MWSLMNNGQVEAGEFVVKNLIEMAENHDQRVNIRTLVRCEVAGVKEWQSIAQTEELQFIREHLYKDPGELIWPRPSKHKKKSAVLLSFLLSGLGQVYLGQVVKGTCIIIAEIFLAAVSFGVLAIPVWIAGMVDANKIQKKLGMGQPVKKWEFF